MCRLGSENTRPTGNRQEHAPNAVCPQANSAGKGLTPKRCSSGQLYSEGARGTPSGTRRARDKLISVLACNMGVFAALFPSLAPPRNAKVGRAGLMKAAKMGC